MAQRFKRKSMKQDEILEAAFDAGEWIEKHWRPVAAAAGGALAVVLLWVGWNWWAEREALRVSGMVTEGLRSYAPRASQPGQARAASPHPSPRYSEALTAFEKAAGAAGGTPPGEVASYYEGATLLRMGRTAEAVPALEKVVAEAREPAVLDPAKFLLVQAYLASGQGDRAVALLKEMAQRTASFYPPSVSLLKLARIYQQQGKIAEARETLQNLIAQSPQTQPGEAQDLLQSLPSGRVPSP